MDSIKRCCRIRRLQSCIFPKENITEALTFSEPPTEDNILQLLEDVETALMQKDGDVKKVPMPKKVQNYASHLEKHLDVVVVGLQISRDALNAIGTLHWLGAGLTIIAMGLDMTLKMKDNKEQCSYIMKESLDIWKKVMKPVHEKKGLASDYMGESMGLIIEGYLYCKDLMNSSKLKRFLCAICHERELESWKKKLELFLLKANAVMNVELIQQILPTPSSTTSMTFAGTIVGLEERKRDVIKKLKLEDKEETRVVVLHGMGGVGKSTLADIVYNQVSVSKERRRCRIELGENPSKDHIASIQKKMVENLTGRSLLMETDAKVITDEFRKVLLSETGDPVLIYVDNVLQSRDLEEFLALDCELITLPKGSRWLVTTRDESICDKVFGRNQGFKVKKFKVSVLNDRDAQKLFFLHAFGKEEPSLEVVQKFDDGRGLIREMVSSICGNLPLALRVLGRILFNENVHTWRSKYDELRIHGELELQERVSNVLQLSYNTLNSETQTAFLMICVCFYDSAYGIVRNVVESLFPWATISRLIELSLLERYPSPMDRKVVALVKMHGLVRTLGYQMAVTRKCAPSKMLTCKQDFLDNDEPWSKIKWLRVPSLEEEIETELLERCKELEVIVINSHVNGEMRNPPQKLKVVITNSSLPWKLEELKELVYLDVQADDLEEFPVAPSTRKLQVLKGFSGATIPKEAVDLHRNTLRKLWCGRIAELSSYFCQEMTKLQLLGIRSFEGDSIPQEMGSLASLEALSISSTTIQELPRSIANLRRLQSLTLQLENLEVMPSGVLGGLKELADLELYLARVTSIPMQDFGQLDSLETLELHLPCVKSLTDEHGVSLKLEKLKVFFLMSQSLSSLEGVQLSCPSLECLNIWHLEKLKVLPPKFITCSTKLRSVALMHCLSLQELSAETEFLLGLESLAIEGCPVLKAIPEGVMKSVESLALVGCPGLQELPGDLDEQKAGAMQLLACDKHLLPPHFLPLPAVIAYSPGDWWAEQQIDSFFYKSFFPLSAFDY